MNDADFVRYLAAKSTIDDDALNVRVRDAFLHTVPALGAAPRVLELGGGIGTMAARLAGTPAFAAIQSRYTLIDEQQHLVAEAVRRCAGLPIAIDARVADARALLRDTAGQWDVLIANAFLDLFDLAVIVPPALRALRPGGVFYFTINFDGMTRLLPPIDPGYDSEIEALYHRSMDERITDGARSGDSHSGSNLFEHLRQAGARILAAGGSDWVVHSGPHGYANDDAFFLRCILGFFEQSVGAHPDVDPARFGAWLRARHAQIDRGELVYLAHQLDFVGVTIVNTF
jgi:SAM-dependent methyltransferase